MSALAIDVEEWRPIPGHPGYMASNLGRVKSPRGTIRKPWTANRLGHLKLGLVENLRYGTHAENMQDAVRHGTLVGWQRGPYALKDHCLSGHLFDEENTLRYGDKSKRTCRRCTAARKAEYVKRQAGVTVECDHCGRQVSKLNLRRHKTSERCRRAA